VDGVTWGGGGDGKWERRDGSGGDMWWGDGSEGFRDGI